MCWKWLSLTCLMPSLTLAHPTSCWNRVDTSKQYSIAIPLFKSLRFFWLMEISCWWKLLVKLSLTISNYAIFNLLLTRGSLVGYDKRFHIQGALICTSVFIIPCYMTDDVRASHECFCNFLQSALVRICRLFLPLALNQRLPLRGLQRRNHWSHAVRVQRPKKQGMHGKDIERTKSRTRSAF